MYTDKKNILQLTALLRAHNIRKIVITPGSRNIPLAQTFSQCPDFECFSVTDERSAGFFAIGLALQSGHPAAVCCTSGSALLNIHPAVAEAFYQQVPLLVLSADRPAAWIGQMDGQTLPQPNVFNGLVRRSVNLPDIHTREDEWFCNRLINEALLELNHHVGGPVHINIPISEPFFDFPVEELPDERVIRRYRSPLEAKDIILEKLQTCPKRMIIDGQCTPQQTKYPAQEQFVILSEYLNNAVRENSMQHFDAVLYRATEETKQELAPQLVITCNGHIVSKRLKQFLRKNRPEAHWHISPDGSVADLFGSLDIVFECTPHQFFEELSLIIRQSCPQTAAYINLWHTQDALIPCPTFAYSEMAAIGRLFEKVNESYNTPVVHLANSSAVRYAQLFPLNSNITVCCNRGVNGIEGSLSAAIGYASVSPQTNYIVIGDLSFFYDMNALWNGHIRNNVRILLLNNEGGEIFHALPGLKLSEYTHRFVTAVHNTRAEGWARERGFEYRSVHNEEELKAGITALTDTEAQRPVMLEVFTDKSTDVRLLKEYYRLLK